MSYLQYLFSNYCKKVNLNQTGSNFKKKAGSEFVKKRAFLKEADSEIPNPPPLNHHPRNEKTIPK